MKRQLSPDQVCEPQEAGDSGAQREPGTRLSVGTVVLLVVAFWLLQSAIPLAQQLVASAAGEESGDFGRAALRNFLLCLMWALLTPIAIGMARRYPMRRPHLARSTAFHLVASIGFAVCSNILYAPLSALVLEADWSFSAIVDRSRSWFLQRFVLDMHVYWVLLLAVVALQSALRARDKATEAGRLRAELAETKLAALRLQLRPHFLFNALNTIAALCAEGRSETAKRMTVGLSRFFRLTLRRKVDSVVSLAEELEFLEEYLEIERVRFSDRLSIDFDVEPETLSARVPTMLLQPIVENAVRYGVGVSSDPSCITLRSRRSNGSVIIEIENPSCVPLSEESGNGLGLSIVRERLAHLYGARATVELIPRGATVRTRVAFPFSSTWTSGGMGD